MNATRIRLKHPLEIDGKLVESLLVRLTAPHLIDEALTLPDDPALRIAATVALFTGLDAPAAYRIHDVDAAAIVAAAERLLMQRHAQT
jgi:hypothetical protein